MDSESDPILCQRSEAEDPLRPRPPWKRRPSPRWRPGGTEPAQPGHDFDPPGPRSRTSHSTGRSTGRSRSRMRQLTTAQRPMLGAIHSIQAIHVSPCVSSLSWRFKLGAVQFSQDSQLSTGSSSLVSRPSSHVSRLFVSLSLSRSRSLFPSRSFPLSRSLSPSLPEGAAAAAPHRSRPIPTHCCTPRFMLLRLCRSLCCCRKLDVSLEDRRGCRKGETTCP